MKVIAHRGAPFYAAENTLASFMLAQSMGLNTFETDVHLTRDGVVVVHHDETLLRTAGVGAVIKESSYGELMRFDIGGGQSIMTLAGLMINLGQRAVLNIEIKTDNIDYPGIESKVLDTVCSLGGGWRERVIISSFNFDTLRRVRALDKQIKIGYLTRDFNVAQVKQILAYSLNISRTRITPALVKRAHKLGLKVWVYTVNDDADYKKLALMGVDAVFSDNPLVGQRVELLK